MTSTLPSRSFMPFPLANFIVPTGPASVATGERLHLYAVMARLETVTVLELAMAAGASAWFVDSWLQAQISAGYAVFDPETDRYALFCRIPD
jgi:hypothetical protein